MSVDVGDDVSLTPGRGAVAVLSPDGSTLAFAAANAVARPPQLYVRRLERLEAAPLQGTDGAHTAFFSPDGKWIGFFANGKLRKVSVSGGAVVVLGDAPDGGGGWWTDDAGSSSCPTAPPTKYVRPLVGSGKRLVSDSGGVLGTWSRTRPELVYWSTSQKIMVVPYRVVGGAFLPEKPRPWSEELVMLRGRGRAFDLHPDGRRLAAALTEVPWRVDRVLLLFNFFDELKRLVPPRSD